MRYEKKYIPLLRRWAAGETPPLIGMGICGNLRFTFDESGTTAYKVLPSIFEEIGLSGTDPLRDMFLPGSRSNLWASGARRKLCELLADHIEGKPRNETLYAEIREYALDQASRHRHRHSF